MTEQVPSLVQPDRFDYGKQMLVVGIERSHMFANLMGIPMQWMEFGGYFGKVPTQVGKRAYGVCHNINANGFDYLTGVEVSAFDGAPEALARMTIAPQYYAIFKNPGHVSMIGAMHQAIWQQWLPQSGKTPAPGPTLEVYLEDFNPLTGFGGMEIWVPVAD